LNAEIKRRTNVVGIFPNDASIVCLVGAMMREQNDEWSLSSRSARRTPSGRFRRLQSLGREI
jgi:transposase-like protein